ncbi:MAG: helix-turn-helix transcriptional regulator [Myxococcales bacterium]
MRSQAFGEEQPSGVRHSVLAEEPPAEPASSPVAPQTESPAEDPWCEPRYVQLAMDGQALCASEGFPLQAEGQRITVALAGVVRMANGAQRAQARIEDLDVQLVRMVHRSGSYYLAVLKRIEHAPKGVKLSEMQERVARLAAQGNTSQQIGSQLGVSSNTVKFHLKRVYELLSVSNRVELSRALSMR